jgi:nitrite reductase (NADH) large subunit
MDIEVHMSKKNIVVIGNGMVGYKFCERMAESEAAGSYTITVLGEEPRPAYDRVNLTAYFNGKTASDLELVDKSWYAENNIDLRLGERADAIDRESRIIHTSKGNDLAYDIAVLATGSYPFVPPTPGMDKKGVFVYRTIQDLDAISEYGKKSKRAAVIGGGLLGLEAAKAMMDMGLETHVVEFSPRLMPRQLNNAGAAVLSDKIESLGVQVLLNHSTSEVLGNGSVTGMRFDGGEALDVDMIVVSAGIRPRDDIAKSCGLEIGARGGVIVDDHLTTSDPHILAIGEVALHREMIYGLVAPGYEMAKVAAATIQGEDLTFGGADMSTKLKLMGVDVASFGDPFVEGDDIRTVEVRDAIQGVYKNITVNLKENTVLGGTLVGDTTEYGQLLQASRSGEAISGDASDLILGAKGIGASGGCASMSGDALICSCNNVTKAAIVEAIADESVEVIDDVKRCTQAGTGCGGCLPEVSAIFQEELKRAGVTIKKELCDHFPHSRQELFDIIRVERIKTFDDVLKRCGSGRGCEVCKPAVASILASLWNEMIFKEDTIQDTNDRFLANIQRRGTYSVVPRVPGGEITPEKLIVIGHVAQKYNLYCKITGGQRIDLLGAPLDQLPAIWKDLVDAGFESGQAYGKSVRTVKSCVGWTWCRFGVQDSTTFAIDIENRYKGIRAPHKIKFAVSGCLRECAEARSKDVGLIATEQGWNLYVGGNGGVKPRHADLLVSNIDEETAIRYIDRFLMYYIHTADRLTRTAPWIEQIEGGLDHVRAVVVEDSLGICEQLEADMARLVNSYKCEWSEVLKDEEKLGRFRSAINTKAPDPNATFVEQRGQKRPVDWPDEPVAHIPEQDGTPRQWVAVGRPEDFPRDGGACVQYGGVQIAVYNFASQGQWYATQNMCPHKRDMVLARGILGDDQGEPKVACPQHKKTFSLDSGACLTGEDLKIHTFPVKIEKDRVCLHLPPTSELKRMLSGAADCAQTECTAQTTAALGRV